MATHVDRIFHHFSVYLFALLGLESVFAWIGCARKWEL